ncbi:MAG: hypothetical protein OQL20_10100, partial [Sedimenticola sp.]|nr:hypothetical protein [Sedimenticola sp.]
FFNSYVGHFPPQKSYQRNAGNIKSANSTQCFGVLQKNYGFFLGCGGIAASPVMGAYILGTQGVIDQGTEVIDGIPLNGCGCC